MEYWVWGKERSRRGKYKESKENVEEKEYGFLKKKYEWSERNVMENCSDGGENLMLKKSNVYWEEKNKVGEGGNKCSNICWLFENVVSNSGVKKRGSKRKK
jgi:hypothetical protein